MSAIGRMAEDDPRMQEMRRRKAVERKRPDPRPSWPQLDPKGFAEAQLLKLRPKRRQEPSE